jgi:ubiquinone/menaquinone biosynthesis C-methylase UbiE
MTELGSETWRTFPVNKLPSSLTLDPAILPYLRKGDRIIDFGCGTGKACTELLKQGLKNIVGVDVNKLAIASAAQRFSKIEGFEGAFIVGDIRHLPFANESFDFGILQAVLTIIPSPYERVLALSEAHRLLSPRGRLYISDFGQTWDSPIYRERYIAGAKETGYEATFSVVDRENYIPPYYAHHFSVQELTDLVTNAGFKVLMEKTNRLGFRTRSGNVVNGIIVVAQS